MTTGVLKKARTRSRPLLACSFLSLQGRCRGGGGDGGAVRDLRARRTSASPRGGAKVLMCSHHMAETEALGHSLGPCSPLALHTQPRTGLHQTAPRKGGP